MPSAHTGDPMSLIFDSTSLSEPLSGVKIFLGGSIPNPERWDGYFDAREITDATAAAARAILTAGGIIVTGAHPTIAPLLLYIAAEFPRNLIHPRVLIYQSGLFESVMPKEATRFQNEGIGSLRITKAAPGDRPMYGHWDASLRIMRRRMFSDTYPEAGIFIGGMHSIREEFELLREINPAVLTYSLARPGGESARLVEFSPGSIRQLLIEGNIYPTLFRKVVEDLASRLDA
jgi:SLOG cluster3 family